MAVTLVTILEESWKACQELLFGSGKRRLNKVRKLSHESQCHSFLYPNDRDARSAITLSFPARCAGVSGDARRTRCRSASAMISLPAGPELCDAQFTIQEIADALSFSSAT
mmetsp:Transcript_23272/g.53422  ORF Transcript_23272/g.53422 Transcript_23272/m.53422 type:complete len:111 (+) Transcript_23272:4455-4787(+)